MTNQTVKPKPNTVESGKRKHLGSNDLFRGGRWESVLDSDGVMARVRWSKPDGQGRFLWVGHYPADGWGQHAAERMADRYNQEGRVPWEWPEYRPTEDTVPDPEPTNQPDNAQLAAIVETLIGIELLEYHNQNFLALDPKKRNEEKRAMLTEALLLTGGRTDVCRYT